MHHHNVNHGKLNVDNSPIWQISDSDFWTRQCAVQRERLVSRMSVPDYENWAQRMENLMPQERYNLMVQQVKELDCPHPDDCIITDSRLVERAHHDSPAEYEQVVICTLCGHEFSAEEWAERYGRNLAELPADHIDF